MDRLSNLPPGVTDFDIEQQAGAFEPEPDESDLQALERLSTAYREEYDIIEDLKAKIKEHGKNRDALIEQFVDKCNEANLDGIKTAQGSFSPIIEDNIGISKENELEAFEELEEQGLGKAIKRTVHFQTLNKHFRDGDLELNDSNQDYFKTWQRKKIRMRRKF